MITKGKKEAIFTALGLSSGCLFHTTLVSIGVALIFQRSIIAFNVLKIAGVIYLFYLAAKTYQNADKTNFNINPSKAGFLKGVLMNILNPKVLLFYLAFLPQFVPEGVKNTGLYMIFLGLIFMLIAFIILPIFAILSSSLNNLLLKNPKLMIKINKISAFVLLILAILLAFTNKG